MAAVEVEDFTAEAVGASMVAEEAFMREHPTAAATMLAMAPDEATGTAATMAAGIMVMADIMGAAGMADAIGATRDMDGAGGLGMAGRIGAGDTRMGMAIARGMRRPIATLLQPRVQTLTRPSILILARQDIRAFKTETEIRRRPIHRQIPRQGRVRA